MKWFNKLEQKLGRYAIHNLMRYMIIISVVGTLVGFIAPGFYYSYLSLDVYQILHGQVWRLVTFVLYPSAGVDVVSIIFYALMLYVYYWIGSVLEQIWGSFRFNAFYFTGIFLIIIAAFVYYAVLINANGAALAPIIGSGLSQVINLENLNLSMFIVFAFMFPDTQFRLYFLIPIKAKWLGILYLIFNAVEIVSCIQSGNYQSMMYMLLVVASIIDFVIFYLIARNPRGFVAAAKQRKRRVVYKNTAEQAAAGPRHKCAICGRTEKDALHLEFRYCSKCEGNYEYCSDHLFTHEHVKRNPMGNNE